MLYIGLAVLVPYLAFYLFDIAARRKRRAMSNRERRLRLGVTALHAVIFTYLCLLPAATFWWPMYGVLVFATIAFRILADSDREAVVDGAERFRHGILQTQQAPLWILVATIWQFIDGAGWIMKLMLPLSMKGLRPLCEGTAAVWALVFLAQLFLSRRPATVAMPASSPQTEVKESELPKAS